MGYDTCYWPKVTCDPPHDPNYGHVEFTDITIKSQAMYHCNMLFNLKGDKVRSCMVRYYNLPKRSQVTKHGKFDFSSFYTVCLEQE